MKRTTLMIVVLVALTSMVFASQVIQYDDSWSNAGFSLEQRNNSSVSVNYSIKELPGLNHLFQTAQTGAPSEYAKIEETISPVVLKIISEWILEQCENK